jgi:hypothetical protein
LKICGFYPMLREMLRSGPKPLSEMLRFLVLVPHRDTVRLLRGYSRLLFGAGFPGAFSFPAAAPLALLSRPCTGEELKGVARTLRQTVLAGGRGGKFTGSVPAAVPFPGSAGALSGLSFFGPALDLALPDLALPALVYPFPRLVLCAALTEGGDCPLSPGAISFRAAAVANMVLRPLDGRDSGVYSLEWRIGRLRWLPGQSSRFPPEPFLPSSATEPPRLQ